MKDKISVCIATYNGELYIKQQIESILLEISEDDEIVISDDSSSDNTLKIIEAFQDKRIRIFKNQVFKNPIFNFEHAIKQATGDLIFLSDQDDVWLSGKVTAMLNALQEYDLVVSDAYISDSNLNVIKDSYFEWRNSKAGVIKNLIKNSYLGCCMAFKRKLLDVVLPFPKNIPMHDMWVGMMAELFFKTGFIKEKLIIYRRHGGNATYLNEDFTSSETLISKLKFRYHLLTTVVRRFIERRK